MKNKKILFFVTGVFVAAGSLAIAMFWTDTIPSPATTVPAAYTSSSFNRLDGKRLRVYGNEFSLSEYYSATFPHRLSIMDGHLTAEGYTATKFLLTRHRSFFRHFDHVVIITECTGQAVATDSSWSLDIQGHPECETFNGVYQKPVPSPAKKLREPVALKLVPSKSDTPLARALSSVATLKPSQTPCPIILDKPSEAVLASKNPGNTILREGTVTDGELFHQIPLDSGEELPSQPGTAHRYQLVYVKTFLALPKPDFKAGTYIPGVSQGRAFLVDMTSEQVVCLGDISATHTGSIQGRTEDDAKMWLTLQLLMAESKALATQLFTPTITP